MTTQHSLFALSLHFFFFFGGVILEVHMAHRWAVSQSPSVRRPRPRANHAFWRPAAKRISATKTPLCSNANGNRRHIFASMNLTTTTTTKDVSFYQSVHRPLVRVRGHNGIQSKSEWGLPCLPRAPNIYRVSQQDSGLGWVDFDF